MKIIEIETIGGIEEKVVIVNCINWAKTHSIIKMFDRAGARHALIYLFIYLSVYLRRIISVAWKNDATTTIWRMKVNTRGINVKKKKKEREEKKKKKTCKHTCVRIMYRGISYTR